MGDEGFFISDELIQFLKKKEINFIPSDWEEGYDKGYNDGCNSCINDRASCGIDMK